MSFSFNFDVHEKADIAADQGNEWEIGKQAIQSPTLEESKATEPVKTANEHFAPTDPGSILTDAVCETITIGTLPALCFLNETVFERTVSEREDEEKVLSRTAAQSSDLITGVYEGGLKVWECTYDLLELMERDGETFRGKRVLDLGCGAGLLGILALKRGAKQVAFQDYNSTVIKQLTLPNVLLNLQGEEEEENDSEEEGERQKRDEPKKQKGRDEEGKHKGEDGDLAPGRSEDGFRKRMKFDEKPSERGDKEPPAKKPTQDPSQQSSSLTGCRFFSGDWTSYLMLLLKESPPPKYDIIFTSETIYNTAYYPALHEALHRLLAPDGIVYLATKAHYFGVGGGLHLFETFVKQKGVFSLKHLWDIEEGLQRHVVGMSFNTTPNTS